MSDEHEVTAGMDRSIGELLEHADRDRLPDTMLYFESHDGRNHVAVSAALMEEDDEEALRGFLAEECGTQDKGLADRFIADWQSGHYRSAVLALRDAGVDFTLDPRLDIRSWSDEPMEQGLEASGLDGARARVEQAMRLIEQAGECLRSADAIALDIDPHYLAAAFTGKTVSLCDQLEQATKQTAAEVEEMRRQEPSVESSDDNDDSTAFFQDFLEGKKIVGLSMWRACACRLMEASIKESICRIQR